MVKTVVLTALGVGGATVVGSLVGFIFKKPSQKFHDATLSFAAGVMLCAATLGLIVPSLEMSISSKKLITIFITILGIFLGAISLNLIDKLVPHLHKITGADIESHPQKTEALNKVLLFVIAIAIHNLPEGIAAGVSFGSENTAHALVVAGGIALQNIPEGMVIVAPMISSGISKKRTFLIALSTGLIEVVGTIVGYFAASISAFILPFALAFAGGTMLYVISDEMIPETHSHGNERLSTYALLVGFAVMLSFDFLLG